MRTHSRARALSLVPQSYLSPIPPTPHTTHTTHTRRTRRPSKRSWSWQQRQSEACHPQMRMLMTQTSLVRVILSHFCRARCAIGPLPPQTLIRAHVCVCVCVFMFFQALSLNLCLFLCLVCFCLCLCLCPGVRTRDVLRLIFPSSRNDKIKPAVSLVLRPPSGRGRAAGSQVLEGCSRLLALL
jgi:hypothetical protein